MTDNIIRIEPEGLSRLFEESLPTWSGLPAKSARLAVMMHRAGRDAYTISERIDMPIGAVLAFLDRVNRARKPAPTERGSSPQSEETGPDAPEGQALEAEGVLPDPPLPPPPNKHEPSRPARDTRPDIELSELQQSVIRRLRKMPVSVSTIARMMRLSPDQVMRVAGEIP